MFQRNFALAWISQGSALGNEVVGCALQIYLLIAWELPIEAIFEQQSEGDAGRRFGAGPDREASRGHSRHAKPLAGQVTVSHDCDRPRPTVQLRLHLRDQVQ